MEPIPLSMPSAEYLHEIFDYNPETGHLFWRSRPLHTFASHRAGNTWNSKFAGKIAGHADFTHGGKWYIRIRLEGKLFRAHRLIWKWMTEEEPRGEIDHIDGAGTNNKWENLRCASDNEQARNKRLRQNNTSGYKGVTWRGPGRYSAQIHINGRIRCLGTFNSAEEAYQAYCAVAKEHHGQFFNSG